MENYQDRIEGKQAETVKKSKEAAASSKKARQPKVVAVPLTPAQEIKKLKADLKASKALVKELDDEVFKLKTELCVAEHAKAEAQNFRPSLLTQLEEFAQHEAKDDITKQVASRLILRLQSIKS